MKKKAKRFLASLTAAAAISSVCCTPLADMGIKLPISAIETSAAETLVSGDYQYYTDDNGAVIRKYTGTAAELTIPEELDGSKVYAIESYAFQRNANIASVTMPTGLKKISNNAFYGCSALKSVKFNEGLTFLGSYSFSGTDLTEVSLPSTLTDATYPFNKCQITKATFADGTKKIPSFIFDNCTKLSEVVIPKSVERIGSYAFQNCSSITEFNFHEGLTFLGNYAFSGTSLTEVSLPATLEDAEYPFSNCKITKATFAEGTVKVPSFIFDNCPKLTEVNLPKTVEKIGSYAFKNCSSLTEFNFHEGLTFLGSFAFTGSGLTEVSLPSTLTDATYPFANSKITKATFAEGSVKVPNYIFNNCTKLTDVNLPKTVEKIGSSAFQNCSSLTEFTFHEGITFLGSSAFSGTAITEVTLPSTLTDATYPFNRNSNIQKATFAEGTTTIPSWIFDNCSKLTEVNLPKTVTKINGSAFQNCSSLENITLHEGITTINNNAFTGTSIKELTLPTTLKSSGYAFTKSKLEKVSFAEGSTAVPTQCFSGCRMLREVVLPKTIKTINSYAFESCSGLKSIELPASLERIDGSAFRRSGLTSIDIPDSVKNLSSYVFNDCQSLKTAAIGSGITTISSSAFSNCKALEKVTLRAAKLKASSNSFYNCRKLSEIDYSNTAFTFDRTAFTKCYSLKDMNLVYLERPVSTMTITTENAAVDGIVDFTVDFSALEGRFNEDSTFTISLTVPDGVTVLPDTFKTNEGTVKGEDVSALKIPFSSSSGKLTFSAKAIKEGTFDIDADLVFKEGKYDRAEPIHSVRFTADVLSLSAPSTTNSLKINVNGTGPKSKEIGIYLGDKLIGSPVADAKTGKYSLAVELPEGESGTKYVLKAKYGDTVTSDFEVVYDKEVPAVGSIKLGVNGNAAETDITDVFTKCTSPVMYLIPNKALNLTAEISNSTLVQKVYFTSTKLDKVAKLEATYDEKTGLWTAKGYFDGNKNYVPGTLNVVVVTKSEYSALQAEKLDIDYTRGYFSRPGNIRFLVEPSGIVYEGAPSNTVKGAEMTVYYMDENGKAVAWDGKDYDQQNPLLTDEFGAYTWDVPEGEWKIVCKAEGFEPMESEWTNVPPVQKGIDFALVSSEAPKVTDLSYDGTNICLKFSKYMLPESVNTSTVLLDSGNDIEISPAFHASTEQLTDTFNIKGDFTDTIDVNVVVSSGCSSYANVSAEEFKKTLRIHEPVTTTTTQTTTTTTTTTTTKPVSTTTTTKPVSTTTTTKPVSTTTTTKPVSTTTTTKPVSTTTTTKPVSTTTTTKPVSTTTTTKPVSTTTTTKPVSTTTTTKPVSTTTTTKPVSTTTATKPATTTTTKPVSTTTATKPATTTTTKPVTTTTSTAPVSTTTSTVTSTTVTTTAPVTTTTQPVKPKSSLGDYNGDGKVDAVDASYILTVYAQNSTNHTTATDEQKAVGDVNKDGKVDAVDASYVLSYYAYWSTKEKISLEEYLAKGL
ncbi:leucine-rich repeat protein [Ruminococcus flavefaciens]|uniref:Leucine rich repeat-containing protein n=1 Tax=Ruminococcus flavefaciens TaxID=1265 RepID=A0A1K1P4A7_RUMFL|nr:leucine-rich repeat protein [Ruminococcus flavefaciens]SFW42412.1 Leucine rich repeat-containing protein [Ruminococcus flavefaciens]